MTHRIASTLAEMKVRQEDDNLLPMGAVDVNTPHNCRRLLLSAECGASRCTRPAARNVPSKSLNRNIILVGIAGD